MPAPARRRLGRDERRQAILAGAARAFAADGFAGTAMADVSAACGVSHLIVYRHFDSKEALYTEVLEQALATLETSLAAGGATGRYGITPAALLRAARADPDAFRVLWRHAAREPEFARLAEHARARVSTLTAAALAEIVPRAQLRWATRATLAYLVESVLVWIEDGDERLDDSFLAATDAALRAGVRSWARSGAGQ